MLLLDINMLIAWPWHHPSGTAAGFPANASGGEGCWGKAADAEPNVVIAVGRVVAVPVAQLWAVLNSEGRQLAGDGMDTGRPHRDRPGGIGLLAKKFSTRLRREGPNNRLQHLLHVATALEPWLTLHD
jgi:hypothetical protein